MAFSRPGELRTAFDGYLMRQARSPRTRLKYGQVLLGFDRWLGARSPGELRSDEVDLYLQSWQQMFMQRYARWPSRATYRAQVAALRAFFAWLERFDLLRNTEGIPVANPMRRIFAPPAEQRANDWLRPAEDAALLAVDCNPQEQLVVWLLRWTGLRVGEATQLLVTDIDLTPGAECIVVRESKTAAGRRTIAIVPQLLRCLQTRVRELEVDGSMRPGLPLLATKRGTPMKSSYAWRVVKRVAFRAGVRIVPCTCGSAHITLHASGCARTKTGENLSAVTPHTLRRTFGSDLLNRGLRLEVVSKLLGHASTTVTERAYAELLDATARRELFHALGLRPTLSEAEESETKEFRWRG
jgi:integrase